MTTRRRPTVHMVDIAFTREAPPVEHDSTDTWWRWEFRTPNGRLRRGWVRGPKKRCKLVARRVVRSFNDHVRKGMPEGFNRGIRQGGLSC